jgi:hypothetical protein
LLGGALKRGPGKGPGKENEKMYLHKAISKILDEIGRETYATISFCLAYGLAPSQRLDLAEMVYKREWYEWITNGSKNKLKCNYKVSRASFANDESWVQYRIYSQGEKGELKIDAYVDAYLGIEYEDYAWKETFSETRYSYRGRPWWLD